jgi:hypothetical protein
MAGGREEHPVILLLTVDFRFWIVATNEDIPSAATRTENGYGGD